MAKQSQLDKAIAALDGEIAVLEAAKARLVAQRPANGPRQPKPVKADIKKEQ